MTTPRHMHRHSSIPKPAAAAAAQMRQLKTAVVIRPPVDDDDARLASGELGICPAPDEPEGTYELVLADDRGSSFTLRPSAIYGYCARDANLLCTTEVEPLLQAVLEGESSAIIAYGATGSGKSFTMGTEALKADAPWANSVGQFVPRRLFELAAAQGLELAVECAMLEVYRENRAEQLYDLLSTGRRRVELSDPGLWRPAPSAAALTECLVEGSLLRNTDRTDGNSRSSRSHAIFMIKMEHKRQGSDGRLQVVKGRLMLVDLAGSERAAAAALGSTTQRQGAGINLGLHYLGLVIEELARTGSTLHYSNTVLTKVLKPALGGSTNGVMDSCNTLMLGCISPLTVHVQRTRDTLDFLAKAGTVKNSVSADITALRLHQKQAEAESAAQQAEVARLRSEVEVLSSELQSLRMGQDAGLRVSQKEWDDLQAQLAESRQQLARERGRADAQEALVKQLMLSQQAGTEAEAAEGRAAQHRALVACVQDVAQQQQAVAEQAGQQAAMTPPAIQGSAATPGSRRLSVFNAAAALTAMQATPVLTAAEAAAEVAAAATSAPADALSSGLDVEAICATGSSNLSGVQLSMLERMVALKLQEAEREDAAGRQQQQQALVPSEARTLRRQLRQREGEVAALVLAVHTYNETLGEAQTALAAAHEDLAAALALKEEEFQQLVQEKMHYLRLASALESALNQSQEDVRQLEVDLREAREALDLSHSPAGRLSGISRLFTRSPAHDGSTPGERRQSVSSGGLSRCGSSSPGSPVAAHRASYSGGRVSPSPLHSGSLQHQVQSRLQRESRQPVPDSAGRAAGVVVLQPVQQQRQQPGEAAGTAKDAGHASISSAGASGSTKAYTALELPASSAACTSAGPAPSTAQFCAAQTDVLMEEAPAAEAGGVAARAGAGAEQAAAAAPAATPAAAGALPCEVEVVLACPRQAGDYLPGQGQVRVSEDVTADVRAWCGSAAGTGDQWMDAIRLAINAPSEVDGLPLPSGITLRHWHQRAMLQRGFCHFCCAQAPDPVATHPDPCYGEQVELCRGCWDRVEPDSWKSASWKVDGELQWCVLCSSTAPGCEARIVYCDKCGDTLCFGCLYRFTDDDLAQVEREDAWLCPKCRPRSSTGRQPLVLRYAAAPAPPLPAIVRGAHAAGSGVNEEEDGAAEDSSSSSDECSSSSDDGWGSSRRTRTKQAVGGKQECPQASRGAVGGRTKSRQRSRNMAVPAAKTLTPGSPFVIELSAGSSDESLMEAEQQRGWQRQRQARRQLPRQPRVVGADARNKELKAVQTEQQAQQQQAGCTEPMDLAEAESSQQSPQESSLPMQHVTAAEPVPGGSNKATVAALAAATKAAATGNNKLKPGGRRRLLRNAAIESPPADDGMQLLQRRPAAATAGGRAVAAKLLGLGLKQQQSKAF